MKRRTLILTLALAAVLAITSIAGCGKKAGAPAEDELVETTEDAEDEEAAEKEPAADKSVEAEAEEEASPTPIDPFEDPNVEKAEEHPVTDETKSEGLNAVPGEPVELKDSALLGVIGETYSIPEQNAHFTLTMNKIELTDKLTSDQKADRVVRITYTYHNNDLEFLMLGQYSFKMLDADGNACQIYYFNPEGDDEVNMQPVGPGEEYTAALGFILGDSDKCTIVYDDLTGNSDTEITWEQTFE